MVKPLDVFSMTELWSIVGVSGGHLGGICRDLSWWFGDCRSRIGYLLCESFLSLGGCWAGELEDGLENDVTSEKLGDRAE